MESLPRSPFLKNPEIYLREIITVLESAPDTEFHRQLIGLAKLAIGEYGFYYCARLIRLGLLLDHYTGSTVDPERQELHLSGRHLGRDDAEEIAAFLAQNPPVTTIQFGIVRGDSQTFTVIMEGLKTNSVLVRWIYVAAKSGTLVRSPLPPY